eukprot:6230406-Pyramimonas_sp.AAC.1
MEAKENAALCFHRFSRGRMSSSEEPGASRLSGALRLVPPSVRRRRRLTVAVPPSLRRFATCQKSSHVV